MNEEMKRCSKCKKTKPIGDFHRGRTRKDGHSGTCKKCSAEYSRKRIEQQKAKDPIAYKKKAFGRQLQAKYGMSYTQYEDMWRLQDGRCVICGQEILLGPVPDVKSKCSYAHVDHDPRTKQIRALLCHNCNCGLGFFKESADRLIEAAAYLRYHEK